MKTFNLSADTVRGQAAGRWLFIFNALSPELELAASKLGKHTQCPVHGGKDGFRLFRDANHSGGGICNTCGAKTDGFQLLMWLRNWSFPHALSYVAAVLGIINETIPAIVIKPALTPSTTVADNGRIRANLRRVWRESKPLRHPDAEPARLYFRNRGLGDVAMDYPNLHFHPALQYRDENRRVLGYFPALLALLENNDGPVTIHRTYLTGDGFKANVEFPKKMMSAPSDKKVTGSAIRLGTPAHVLGVTEGIESALAVIQATGMVTWPLVSSSLMPNFELPGNLKKLVIWADLDRPATVTGIQAGSEAAAKLAHLAITLGLQVEIREPKGLISDNSKSLDCLDILNQYGSAAFALSSPYFKTKGT